jgi:hypothetical protein
VKRFECECGQRVFFDNTRCLGCGLLLGFDPKHLDMLPLRPSGGHRFETPLGSPVKRCRNAAEHGSCNWLLSADDPEELCVACRTTRTIPDLQRQDNFMLWVRMEHWKRRLFYTLLDVGLLSVSGGGSWPSFRFLEDQRRNPNVNEMFVSTGHKDGVITINLSEADDVSRQAQREGLIERYRTVLGHLRHEVGHFFFPRLTRNEDLLEECRRLFGDEREPYDEALQRHYENGPPSNWSSRYVSAYASMHPREDFAESFAHYLLIVDALETANAEGLGSIGAGRPWVARWIEVAIALNEMNRSLGSDDAYPFTLPTPVVEKLELVSRLVARSTGASTPA